MSRTAPSHGRALVTGASRGIGAELARVLAADGRALVLVARTRDDLEAVAAELRERVPVRVVPADLSEPAARDRVARVLEEEGIRISVLVNNAGFGTFGPFVEAEPEEELDQVRVNVEAVTDLTRRFLPGMVEAGGGGVLNVASTAAFQPGPLMAVYYATKAYVLYFSEALAEEVSGTGVTVTCLCPGPTRTGFHARADMEDSRLLSFGLMDARKVAVRGYRGFRRGKRLVVPGLLNRLGTIVVRLLPRGLVARTVRVIQARME